MASIKKISGLDAKSVPTGDDLVVIEDSTGVNYKVKASDLNASHNHSELLATATIDSSKWSAKSQSITVAGAYAANSGIIMVTPVTRADADNWCDYGLFLDDSDPVVNTVKITCTSTPPVSINVFVYRIG